MKAILTLILATFCIMANSQTIPIVNFVTQKQIQGLGEKNNTIHISVQDGSMSDYQTTVDKNGVFNFTFPNTLTTKNIVIWSTNENNRSSQKIFAEVSDPNIILQDYDKLKFTSIAVAGKTVKYKATIWNTNFSIPLARFNFTKDSQNKRGDLILFNSIGAGFGISGGELTETRDYDGNLIHQEFVNTIGVHFGFLFSAGTGEDTKNVFAPTVNLSILDFQIGLGYELGNLNENQKPLFLTLSYAIPLYKLRKGGFWIWKNSKPIDNVKESRLGG